MSSGAFPQPGSRFVNRYDVMSLIAVGGFSRVYRALDPELDREVAVKVMSPARLASSGLASAEKRFYREARVISRLVSPYTVRLFDYGRTNDGLLFLIMEFVEGRDLDQALAQDGPMTEDRVRSILVQLLESLSEMHALDILHRDVKPSNVMLCVQPGYGETVRVIDFGIAKSVAKDAVEESKLTVDGLILGTPRYMSPEQAIGAPNLGPTSDLFSAGLVAYELLVGRSPYPEDLQGLRSIISAEPTVPKLLGVSDELREIVNRMLRLNPAERFQRTNDVLHALGVEPTAPMSLEQTRHIVAGTVSFPILGSSLGRETVPTIWAADWISADTRIVPLNAVPPATPPPLPTDTSSDEEPTKALIVETETPPPKLSSRTLNTLIALATVLILIATLLIALFVVLR